MANDPQPQQPDRDPADRALIRRAAAWLRDNPDQATGLGVASATDARALAVVLDILAAELPHLDADLRRHTIQGCQGMLGGNDRRPPRPLSGSPRSRTSDT
jgi:hypothetical protein